MQDAGWAWAWAWVKAVLGISVFVATVRLVGSDIKQAELVAAVATDPSTLDAILRSERNMIWVLIVLIYLV